MVRRTPRIHSWEYVRVQEGQNSLEQSRVSVVYVLNMRGNPLMPTTPRKAKQLLKKGEAKVVKRTPFVIRLTKHVGRNLQQITNFLPKKKALWL